jgi:hypothetical protein
MRTSTLQALVYVPLLLLSRITLTSSTSLVWACGYALPAAHLSTKRCIYELRKDYLWNAERAFDYGSITSSEFIFHHMIDFLFCV